MYKVWYSTEASANYLISNTLLSQRGDVPIKRIFESDATNPRNFHTVPDHLKKILYLDSPDIIVEHNTEPIFTIEFSREAGTGHNSFQRFARLAASVENDVPSLYVYPEAVIIRRNNAPRWDRINPLIFAALEGMMSIYDIPALLFYYPSDYRTYAGSPDQSPNQATKGLRLDAMYGGCPDSQDDEMQAMFEFINEIILSTEERGVFEGRRRLLRRILIRDRRSWMGNERALREGFVDRDPLWSPLSSTKTINTIALLSHLSRFETGGYQIGELIRSREQTVCYCIDAHFRGDPYPGALAAIDYLLCREGRTFEERRYNLILVWGRLSFNGDETDFTVEGERGTIHDFIRIVKNGESRNLLGSDYNELSNHKIPRYYMQVRHGSAFSKAKEVRIYSYFADAILFPDGALWRDG